MRAVVCRSFGGPASLSVEEIETPTPNADQALVRIHAAGVNFADVLIVAGRYQVKPPLPFVAGQEFAGEIIAVGDAVKNVRVGDRVMGAPVHGGAFAEYVAAAADKLWKIPEGFSFAAAAGLIIGHGTAYFGLQRARLLPNEWILITGAAGGVGVAAVEISKRLGVRVIAAVGSEEKATIARAHGADAVVNYSSEDLRMRVKQITERGYDVLLDTVGGDVFDAALHASAPEARLLVVGFATGRIPSVPANYLLLKNLSLLGIGFGAKVVNDPAAVQAVVDGLAALHSHRPFSFELGGEFALESVPRALEQLMQRRVLGKLVINPIAR